ncbi:hypothetical protein TrLO_g6088 [Triparma laevis f. longispina]|uniref:Sodium/calcium exchanger membrane region domain-containing protein n=1 Tax=Triparma laevis f. longispina TaxID=1714387 RepID=A0A9W7CMF2_9STRA|nr:hypothetical protein TrLO_g6088 [Triparma laevis f. longispina]
MDDSSFLNPDLPACDISTFFESFCLGSLADTVSLPLCGFILVLCFLGLSIVCDEFLVPSLELICVSFNVPEDIAGVTFMAFGSAAPEIVINAVGTVREALGKGEGEGSKARDLGVGAIIGSGIIAFSIIPGVCALVSSKGLVLKRRPLVRDVLAYAVSLVFLIHYIDGGEVDVRKASVFIWIYLAFCAVVFISPKFNRKFFGGGNKKQSFVMDRIESMKIEKALKTQSTSLRVNYGSVETQEGDVERVYGGVDNVNGERTGEERASEERSNEERSVFYLAWNGISEEDDEDDEEDFEAFLRPNSLPLTPNPLMLSVNFSMQCLSFLLRLPLLFIIPRASVQKPSNYYPLTFLLSFVWISFYSYVLSTSITYLTTLTPMSPTFYGTALVAIGAEIPDLIQCSTVAKRGYGAMAVSNALGSQVLNICVGLGLPWTISCASGGNVRFKNASDNKDLSAAGKALGLCVVVFAVLTIGMAGYTGKKPVVGDRSGKILVGLYVVAMGGFIGWYFTFK